MEKKITTKCPFPLVKLQAKIKYAEVQKPSGVGYVILVLIKDAKDRKEKLCDVLRRFGVPEDLQFIFADEIEVLLNRQILKLARNNIYQREYFEECTIGNFAFTENGDRMFREGAIPTGEEKSKIIDIYYNPLTFEFAYKSPIAYMSIDKSLCFPEKFMDKVETDFTGLKDFIIENPKGAGLQQQERLLECDIANREDLFSKIEDNLDIKIDKDGMEVAFKTAGATDFYEKYFTPDMLEREFGAKKKFVFDVPTISVKGFEVFKRLSAIYLPEEYTTKFSRPVKLILIKARGKIIVKRNGTTTLFENGNVLESATSGIYSDWSFISIDGKEMRYYTAARVTLIERVLDKPLSLNLLVEQEFGAEEKAIVLQAIFDECLASCFSIEHANIVKAICELTKDNKHATQYADRKINDCKSLPESVEVLLLVNRIFSNFYDWQSSAVEYTNELYNNLINQMTKENIVLFVKTVRTLDSIRNSDKDELLLSIIDKFGKLDEVELFSTITSAGFSENDALSYANIVKVYTNKILAGETKMDKSTLSDKFEALAHNLSDLKENLGINSTVKYAFREGYDISRFIDNFKAYTIKLKELGKYKGFAKEEFIELEKYKNIMQPVFDYIMSERNASSKPEQITESYIRGKISSGEWNRAICDMHIRLEWLISSILKAPKEKALDLIDRAKKDKLIDVDTADLLHELRKFRNKLQHPTEEQLSFDRVRIGKWADALFSINLQSKGDK